MNRQKSQTYYTRILEKLHLYRRKKRTTLFLTGLFRFLAYEGAFILFLLVLEALFQFSPAVRQALLGVFFLGTLLCLAGTFFAAGRFPWSKRLFSDDRLADEAGDAFPDIRDQLVDALQIIRNLSQNKENYSPDLAEASLKSVYEKIKSKDFQSLVPKRPLFQSVRNFSMVVVSFTFLALLFNRPFVQSVVHFSHPGQSFKEKAVEAIRVTPGDWQCLTGDTLVVAVRIQGKFNRPIEISWKEQSKKRVQSKILRPDSSQSYHFQLAHLKENLVYFVKAGKEKTRDFTVTVEKRPMVRRLRAELIFPAYTGLPSRILEENQGEITALKGTRVRLKIRANKGLSKAKIIFKHQRPLALRIRNREAGGAFRVMRDDSYFVRLEDTQGHGNAEPIHYKIAMVTDQPPVVEITQPGQDVDLSEEMILPLQIQAEDDFGFSSAELRYRVHHAVVVTKPDTNFHGFPLTLPEEGGTKIQFDFTWRLGNLQMLPGDYVEYFVKILDNDAIAGFKPAVSRTYLARFPSMAEIYRETTSAQDESIQELEELVRESGDLKKEVDKITDEMKRNPEMNWTKKQELKELAEKQQRLAQKAEKLKNKLDEAMDRLQQNNMLSDETIQKYAEVQKLFDEALTPEMKKMLQNLEKALEKMDSKKLDRAGNKFKLNEDNFKKSLERTLNLLKRLRIEQKLDQAKKMAENLKARQKAVNQSLEKASRREKEGLRKLEKKIEEDTQRLKEALKKLQREMREFPDMQAAKLKPSVDKAQESAENMQKMGQELQANNEQGARQAGNKSERNLQQLSQMLGKMKQGIVNKQKKEVMKQMARSSSELLRLSEEQEALQRRTRKLSSMSPKFNQMAEKQLSLLNRLNQITKELYRLSQKTFFVTPEIGKAVGKGMGNMRQSLSQMEERNGRGASAHQKSAMGALNEAVLHIQQSMKSLSSASSSVGMEEYLKQLQKMAGMQQGLNQQTLQLSLKMAQQGRLTESQQGRLRRMAAQQRQLAKAMNELQKQYGGHSNVLGNMEEMAKQMEDVAKRMELSQLDRETIQRQQKILSRLLDAQRSVRQRDFSKRRKSEAGKNFIARNPGALPVEILQKRDQLREDILRAKKAGYSEDFLNLIQSYYEALYEVKHEKK